MTFLQQFVTFWQLNLHICDFFTVVCDFLSPKLTFLWLFLLACDFLSTKFTFLCFFYTSLWHFVYLNSHFCIFFTIVCDFFSLNQFNSFATFLHWFVTFYHLNLNYGKPYYVFRVTLSMALNTLVYCFRGNVSKTPQRLYK